MKRRKIGKKVNGFRGSLRMVIGIVILFLQLWVLLYLNTLFGGALIIFIISSIGYYYYLKFNDKYHIRPIKAEEYQKVIGKKLIHYTDFVNEEQIEKHTKTGSIELFGNSNAKANYRMKRKDKTKKFVWFHTESDSIKNEPDFDSFAESHIGESIPRAYKVIIEVKNFKQEELFINPVNGNILVLGDVKAPAIIESNFKWYNEKVYFWSLISGSFVTFFLLIPVFCHQFWGLLLNWFNKLKSIFLK